MAKIIGFLIFCFPLLLWSKPINRDSILNLLPKKFNGQIAIKKNNNFIFRENFGAKGIIHQSPINDSTVFNIGQISHTIIFYLFEELFKKGEVQPEDSVYKYIPDLPYRNLQIKHLLEHQSGLPSSYVKLYHRKVYNNWNLKLSERSIRFDNEDIINILIKNDIKLNFSPGDSTAYSDLNYLILSSLIEKITHLSFSETTEFFFTQTLSFKPILSANTDTVFNKAYGYRVFSNSKFQLCENLGSRGLPFDDGTYGNQHIYLSASNLANWGKYIFNKKYINAIKNSEKNETIGGIKYNKNLQIISKTGAFGGTTSTLIFIPENEIILAINTNKISTFNDNKSFNELIKYLQNLN
tara:strand:+ start:2108 stop:3166 length:1059 start_codon:yes stop_codon:yes gene_type:complete